MGVQAKHREPVPLTCAAGDNCDWDRGALRRPQFPPMAAPRRRHRLHRTYFKLRFVSERPLSPKPSRSGSRISLAPSLLACEPRRPLFLPVLVPSHLFQPDVTVPGLACLRVPLSGALARRLSVLVYV
ncbi:hypothetical protein SJAG_03975 [Schizosaccharomyces japonicus yFS275]|uniref:Uncharacterized protein n=1 Tax=Schizosaccharomyces japonicus (strain yFS275 / FY16936) TaxID=402676 RepID=B6K5K1_SCHJY|nr:hypothetical protein SJAG_03975 [Schizosaccharomyces japonicus yFS275]EEB08805.1 hypothetical protein SJAG_03975 [Schizosaccharomyces japonicus yFS275]